MNRRIFLPGPLADRHFPEADTLTHNQYHRLASHWPAPLTGPQPTRTLICPACTTEFVPHRLAGRPRFCSPTCRRWYHYGTGAKTRRTLGVVE